MVRTRYKPVLNKAGDRRGPSPTAESNLSGRFEGPRKKDPAAMNSPTHAPEMPRDALCAENAPTHKHANVPRGGEETHGTH